LVEDDKVSADFVKKALSKNYIVDISFTASDALQKAKNHQYPVLLLDINLGFEIDGIELLKRIKELPHYKDTPAIAMTAYASSNDREEFLSKGFSYYISKPFMVNDLRELLEKVLNKN
jgi:CheY-like chemotaxis protein